MSDYLAAEITIGGEIRRSLVPSLCRAIAAENLALDWDGEPFQPEGAVDLTAACKNIDGVQLLALCDNQARYGQFERLEKFLGKHRISYRRHCEGNYAYDADLVEYRPETGVVWMLASNAGLPLVALDVARDAQAALDQCARLLQDRQYRAAAKHIRSTQYRLMARLPVLVQPLQPFSILSPTFKGSQRSYDHTT